MDFTPKENNNQERQPMFNANSAIIGLSSLVIIGVMGWVGSTTQSTATSVTKIETQMPYMTETIKEMKSQMDGMVRRSELDSRLREADENNRALIKQILESKK